MLYHLYILQNNKEIAYYIQINNIENLDNTKYLLKKILSKNFEIAIHEKSVFKKPYIEIGPKLRFKTPWCSNMLEILKKSKINYIERIEFSIKYQIDEKINYDKMLYQEYDENIYFPTIKEHKNMTYYVDNIRNFNNKYCLGFDEQDLVFYESFFKNRNPTNVELFDLSQCNSEHARHHFFNGNLIDNYDNLRIPLMAQIKSTNHKFNNSIVSFKDNASIILGNDVLCLETNINYKNVYKSYKKINFTYKAETHNFPTGICPFPGASTGVGGRIRDNLSAGLGGDIIAGTAGYCVGDIFSSYNDYDFLPNNPLQILIEASNGASDYGNKIGEPIIMGFCRSFRGDYNNSRIEWLKPIMFSGGMGKIFNYNCIKKKPQLGNLIIRIGGEAYKIGLGGGTASSREQNNNNLESDYNAVQRGDPEMANKLVRFIRIINSINNLNNNIILSIHDQGSGGMANVTREISEPYGAKVWLDKVKLGDESMNTLEKWICEYQEQITFLTNIENYFLLKEIAKKENLPFICIGYIDNTNKLLVETKNDNITPVNLSYQNCEKKTYYIKKPLYNNKSLLKIRKDFESELKINDFLYRMFKSIDIGSKQFLTNKVDRSVSGLIIQQQCIGPFHLPLSNLSIVNSDYNSKEGLASAIGEQPLKGIGDPDNIENMVRLTVGEMLTNIMWTPIKDITKINSVANWMWSSINEEDGWLLEKAVSVLTDTVKKIGFSINGGKDSLSMQVKNNETTEIIKGPNTLVLSGYTNTYNLKNIITPNLKSNNSVLLLLKPEIDKFRLGNTSFYNLLNNKEYNLLKSKCDFNVPDFQSFNKFKIIFNSIQSFIKNKYILSGHDISDGGLLTTLCEMSISSNIGIEITIKECYNIYEFLFNEEIGIVIESSYEKYSLISNYFKKNNINYIYLGETINEPIIKINNINNKNIKTIFNEKIPEIRKKWQETSYSIEEKQCNKECIIKEKSLMYNPNIIEFNIPDILLREIYSYNNFEILKPKVAILREEGSNGDREMIYCFNKAGFEVYDINLNDIENDKINLGNFKGLVFVGGFSFSDVLGSAYGWYSSIVNNPKIKYQFDNFYKRDNTFSLGVCNGCQLMSLLGWVPNISLEKNISNRFESRYSFVKVIKNNSIFLKNMEDLIFGIWIAHGEGRIVSKNTNNNNFPIKYVNDKGIITEDYPFNPNGSIDGNAAISSSNGRHLALMPHPERCVLEWQLPWIPEKNKCDIEKAGITPWMSIFYNAYLWSINN